MPVEPERPLQLLVLSSSLPPTPRVVSQPSIAAKSAALLVCLTPVGAERGQSLLLFIRCFKVDVPNRVAEDAFDAFFLQLDLVIEMDREDRHFVH